MAFPGGDTRDRQSRPGKLRLKRKAGTWGRRMQERRPLAHLGGRSPPQSADTKPGPRVGGTRGRERCAGRGLFVCGLCSRSGPAPAPPPVRAPPPPALRVSGSPAPRRIVIRVPSLPLERALRAPCARTISLRDLGAGGGVREGEVPRPQIISLRLTVAESSGPHVFRARCSLESVAMVRSLGA